MSMREFTWPDRPRAREPYEVVPFLTVKERERHQSGKKEGCCRACYTSDRVTKHHIHPRQIVKKGPTMSLCRGCHDVIHRLPNKALMEMSADEQIIFIQIRLGLVSKAPNPNTVEDYSI